MKSLMANKGYNGERIAIDDSGSAVRATPEDLPAIRRELISRIPRLPLDLGNAYRALLCQLYHGDQQVNDVLGEKLRNDLETP